MPKPFEKGNTFGAYYRGPGKLKPGVHPLVRFLFEEMARQKITNPVVAKQAGVSKDAMWEWRNRTTPKVSDLEACLNAIGYELVVRRRESD